MDRTRSPFPGMDPWLERLWDTVHGSYVYALRDQLAPRLPDDLYAEAEATVYVVGKPFDRQSAGRQEVRRPDVGVYERGEPSAGADRAIGVEGIAVAEPVTVLLEDPLRKIRHVAIRDMKQGDALVAAIEVISPTNKDDRRARQKYVTKRDEYYEADVTVVEIDLLRAGDPIVDVPWERVDPGGSAAPYTTCVRPAYSLGLASVQYYPTGLRTRLPRISIPLRRPDERLVMDLQEPLDLSYERGRYWMRVDYSKPPEPPLSADDAAWAERLLRERGIIATTKD